MAVRFRSFGPRVKMQPWTSGIDVLRRDAAVAEDVLRAGIDRDDAVEHARQRVGVELDEDGWLVGHDRWSREQKG